MPSHTTECPAPPPPCLRPANLLTLPVEVHERVTGLGDVGHSHALVHAVDVQMQPTRAVQPQSQDGAFRTRVQIWPKLLLGHMLCYEFLPCDGGQHRMSQHTKGQKVPPKLLVS